MKSAYLFSALLAGMVLVACGNDHEKNNAKLFEQQRALMDKAKNVGNTLQQQADEQSKSIDQQSQ